MPVKKKEGFCMKKLVLKLLTLNDATATPEPLKIEKEVS